MAIKFRNHNKILRLSILTGLFAILVIFLILFWPQNKSGYSKKIKIKQGVNLTLISKILLKENIISNSKTFILAAKILGKERSFPIGTFTLENAKSNYKIIQQLVNGNPEVKKIMILEGWNTKQIAKELNEKLGLQLNIMMDLSKDKVFLNKNNINANSIEGYLFPDTYMMFKGETSYSVFAKLIKKHNDFWIKTYLDRARELNLTKHEIITLASIIEGEAIYDIERAKISGVYHNRLNLKMKLQADPTIQYIIKDGPRRLLNKDLRIKSPYNTYLNKGLPPGPINSPGRNSLIAALYPEEHDFIFFVARGDGYHTFTINEKDHNRAKKHLQKIRKKIKSKKYNG